MLSERESVSLAGFGSGGLKEKIVAALANEQKLKARAAYNKLVKDGGVKASYQGVHKALGQLVLEGVVRKEKGAYSLSEEWVSSLKTFSDDLVEKCLKKRTVSVLGMSEYSSATLHFKGMIAEPYYWTLDQVYQLYNSNKTPVNCFTVQRRVWPLTVLAEKEYEQFKALSAVGEQVLVCGSDAPIDELLINLWKQFGFKCKLGADYGSGCDVEVSQDFVFQFFHPSKTIEEWDKLYDSIDVSKKLDISALHKFAFDITAETKLVITRNKEFADQWREKIKGYFKK